MNMELYYPSILAKYNVKDCCPLCNTCLDVKTQYLYMKKYKDECSVCLKYNNSDNIYCLCEQCDDYMAKAKIITCSNCTMYPKKAKSVCCKYEVGLSFRDLYIMAKTKNIKHRSLMSKEELYAACCA